MGIYDSSRKRVDEPLSSRGLAEEHDVTGRKAYPPTQASSGHQSLCTDSANAKTHQMNRLWLAQQPPNPHPAPQRISGATTPLTNQDTAANNQ